MNVGRRSQMLEIMNFCEGNHFAYNITWTFDRQYEVQFMYPEHEQAVVAFLKEIK